MDGQATPGVATRQICVTKRPEFRGPPLELEPWIVCALSIGLWYMNFCDADHVAVLSKDDQSVAALFYDAMRNARSLFVSIVFAASAPE